MPFTGKVDQADSALLVEMSNAVEVVSDHDPMPQNLSAEETAILATYSNRQDAELGRARLAEHEIDAFVVADDVHPPFQFTEGVELRVLEGAADRARRVLGEEPHLSAEGRAGAAMPSASAQQRDRADLTFGSGGLVQATAWTYVAAFLFMVAIILTGLLVGL